MANILQSKVGKIEIEYFQARLGIGEAEVRARSEYFIKRWGNGVRCF